MAISGERSQMPMAPAHSTSREMPFAVRPLEERDIPQSSEIEREVFPTLFPYTSFRRELKNRAARYLIAWRCSDPVMEGLGGPSESKSQQPTDQGLMGRLLRNAGSLSFGRYRTRQPTQPLTGFIGTWYMTGEAHVVSVGVKSEYRGQGIGELLLISAIEQAAIRDAAVVTLEVRVSNHPAKSLYRKYGFIERGIRKSYYTDNREDAAIMTTEPIQHPPFEQGFQELVRQHEQRWGRSHRRLS